MTVDKVKLKALAEAAAAIEDENEWYAEGGGYGLDPTDLKFIAAAKPAAVLALLAEIEALSKDLESHKRMLLSAAVSIGTIGEALGAEMDDDPSELEGLAVELRKDAERHRWLRQHEFDIGSYHGVHEHNHAAWFEHIDDEEIDRSIAEEAKFADDNEQPDQESQ